MTVPARSTWPFVAASSSRCTAAPYQFQICPLKDSGFPDRTKSVCSLLTMASTFALNRSPAAKVNSTRFNWLRRMTFMGLWACAIRSVLIVRI